MNLSVLMRNFLGDFKISDSKTLQLKEGQIVKGLVLQLLNNQEALIQINGIQLKAKLEIALSPGDHKLLQVQPKTPGGLLLLKSVEQSVFPNANESVTQLLNVLNIKNTTLNRELIQTLHKEEIPLTKENITQFQSIISSSKDRNLIKKSLQSAIFLFNRGLPMTETTMEAIRQIQHGKPLHELIHQLYKSVAEFKSNLQTIKEPKLQADLLVKSNLNPNNQSNVSVISNQPNMVSLKLLVKLQNMMKSIMVQQEISEVIKSNNTQSPDDNKNFGITKPVQKMNAENPVFHQSEINVQRTELSSLYFNKQKSAELSNQQRPVGYMTQDSQLNENWIARFINSLGLDYEKQLVNSIKTFEFISNKMNQSVMKNASLFDLETSNNFQNLKGLMLQLLSADDLPNHIKEQSLQLLNHITGQQLFLTSNRSDITTHFTIFIPIYNDSGGQTSSVNIQSRYNKNGELDVNHCSLWFDLNMKTLGETLIDVQVVSNMVSIQIHNDHPKTKELIDSGIVKPIIESLGFQFLSLKHFPIPEKQGKSSERHNTRDYINSAYKGVDVRV
ncbi:hypothetical protein [Chengkuizengella marina]|uniref:Hook-length control protein FliK n=1 Tax=Chengkuizengella marina TaxID=2507566 RepID=A0A6N9Q3Z8_9BACL|nr:hypothetical protein [Chengkuizengella marina]NBI29559.1 hypothetical protein [Chengkuizengella marina]